MLILADPALAKMEQVQIPVEGTAAISGIFIQPDQSGPHPAIIALHGCSGLLTKSGKLKAREQDWADRWLKSGYAVLFPDSFTSRGVQSICKIKNREIRPEGLRSLDAYAALQWLQNRADIVPDQITLVGWSNGAMTGLWVMSDQSPARPKTLVHAFQSAILFYPGCFQVFKQVPEYKPVAPMLFQMGAEDDWTSAKNCLKLIHRVQESKSGRVEWDVYDGAYHGFDNPKGKYQAIITKNDVYKTGQKTVHVGPNPQARSAAIERVTHWLEAQRNGKK